MYLIDWGALVVPTHSKLADGSKPHLITLVKPTEAIKETLLSKLSIELNSKMKCIVKLKLCITWIVTNTIHHYTLLNGIVKKS